MGKLIYSMLVSLDGYTEDVQGNFGWGAEDSAELHDFFTEFTAGVGTFLNGRRMYETMVFWETAHLLPDMPRFVHDFAKGWQSADKVVYSTTLAEPRSARTRIERSFDPKAVALMKAKSTLDLTIDGPNIASQAIKAGLVDSFLLAVCPVIVGGGKRFFPPDVTLDLELIDERRFANGVIILHYANKRPI